MSFTTHCYRIEHAIYWAAWICGLMYAAYEFAIIGVSQRTLLDRHDLKRGSLSNNPYDASDFEWQALKNLCRNNWSFVFIHIIISNVFNYYNHRTVKLISWISLSSFTIYHILGLSALLLVLVNIMIVVLLAVLGKNILGYVLSFGVIVAAQITDLSTKMFGPRQGQANDLTDYDYRTYYLICGLCYLNARGLSAVVDNLTIQEKKQFQAGKDQFFDKLLTISAYMLYLPGFFSGPIFTYDDFEAAVQDKPRNRELKSYTATMWELMAFLANVLLFELMLHWIYSSAYVSRPNLVIRLGTWQLSGFLFALCQMYYQKYMCIFGFFRSVASLDGHQSIAPALPQCPASMHRSSQLWRHFDTGFYRWIIKYIYKPLGEPNFTFFSRICATLVSFLCVAAWHLPLNSQIIYWISINVVCVIIELIGSSLNIDKLLPGGTAQRIKALLGVSLFGAALMSSVYFLSSFEIGSICLSRFMNDRKFLIVLSIFLYCGCHVSMDYERLKKNRQANIELSRSKTRTGKSYNDTDNTLTGAQRRASKRKNK